MGNLFDTTNYPQTEPKELIVADRWAWKRTDLGADYAPASYTLSYSCRLEGAAQQTFSITASASGSDYLVEVSSTTTKNYTVGRYHWQAYITRNSDSERVMIDYGTWELKPNRVTSYADPRSHARKVLDAIEAVIEGRATKDQESYTIGDRSLSRTPIPELLQLRKEYQAEVRVENLKEAARNGKAGNKLVYKL